MIAIFCRLQKRMTCANRRTGAALGFFSELARRMTRGWILVLLAATVTLGTLAQDVRVSELVTVNASGLQDVSGQSENWIELYNSGKRSFQLDGCYFKTSPSAETHFPILATVELEGNGYITVHCDPGTLQKGVAHCDASLASEAGWIGLYTAQGALLDSLSYPALQANQAYGRANMAPTAVYFNRPTPNAANDSIFASQPIYSEPPVASLAPGTVKRGAELELTAPAGHTIYWAQGSRDPLGKRGKVYSGPIRITGTKIIRATCISPGKLAAPVQSLTYFTDAAHAFPVVSIVTPRWSSYYHHKSREITGRRRPASLSWFDGDSMRFAADVAIKLAGGASRTLAQKSISVELRPAFGAGGFRLPNVYSDKNLPSTSKFVLRNFGNGHPKVFFKDVLLQQLLANNPNIDYLGYQPVVVYINGAYRGLYNVREKKSVGYATANHGVPPEHVEMLELLNGSIDNPKGNAAENYKELIGYVRKNNLANAQHYMWVADRVDLANFTDYQIAQIVYANTDWPQANVKLWRDARGGKWRWILFDLDQGMLPGQTEFNAMAYALGHDAVMNADDLAALKNNTLLLRKLMENTDFRQQFATRFADLLNSAFRTSTMLAAVDAHAKLIRPEVPKHLSYWSTKGEGRTKYPESVEAWQTNLDVLRYTLKERPRFAWHQLEEELQLKAPVQVAVNQPQTAMGTVVLNGITIDSSDWKGKYFPGSSLTLEAKATAGFHFVKWLETGSKEPTATVTVGNEPITLTAVFEQD